MFLVGGLLLVHRALARILNRQRRGDNHRLTYAAMFLRFQHHARQAWIHRQLRELTAQWRQFVSGCLFVGGYRPQFFEQAYTVLNVTFIRRFNKRKRRDIAQPQGSHLQNN